MIQKTFANVKKASEGSATFIASTASSDRYGDVVDQSSWLLESFKKNGVILLNHRQDMLPIGRATKIDVVDGQLEVEVEFDLGDELGAEVARKVSKGFMSAVSVGFQPNKSIARAELPTDHPAFTKQAGMFFQQNELLEVSVVTIPANAEAVAKQITLEDLQLKKMINKMIKTELLSMPNEAVSKLKHIIAIEEATDSIIVTYAKAPTSEEEVEVEEEVEEEATFEMYDNEEEEDEKTKNLLIYLLTKESNHVR